MGQQEVYTFLKKSKGKWFTSKEIGEKLKLSNGSITKSLMKLRKASLINFKLRNRTIKSGSKRNQRKNGERRGD